MRRPASSGRAEAADHHRLGPRAALRGGRSRLARAGPRRGDLRRPPVGTPVRPGSGRRARRRHQRPQPALLARRSGRRRRMDRRLGRAGPAPGHPAHRRTPRRRAAACAAPRCRCRRSTAPTCDGRSLQTTGVVKELSIWNGYLRLHVTAGQHSVELRVQEFPLLDMSALVGASIQSKGVCVQAPAAEAKVADLRRDGARVRRSRPARARCTPPLTRATAALPVLTRLDAIRRMSRAEAGRYYPVRVAGIATYVDPAWSMLFLQDGATGIFVALHGAQSARARGRPARGQRLDGPRQLRAGDRPPVVPRARIGDAAGGAAGALSAADDRGGRQPVGVGAGRRAWHDADRRRSSSCWS